MSGSNMLLPSVGRPVVLRMYAASRPLMRIYTLVSVSVGAGVIAITVRYALWPVPPGPDAANLVSGTIAFLVAGIVASLMGTAAWELRACPFAQNTPRLAAQLVREIRITGFILFGTAAGLGAAMGGALVGASWFLAIAAALGYSVGLLSSVAPSASRFGGAVGLVLAVSPILLMPEIAKSIAPAAPVGGFLWAMLGAGIVLVSTESCGARLARRDEGAQEPSLAALAFGMAKASQSRRAPRDGTDRFRGTRRSDLDWVRALLHEQFGARRGGLVGRTVRTALVTAITMVSLGLWFRAMAELPWATGVAPTAGSDSSLDWLARFVDPSQERMDAGTFAMAGLAVAGLGMVVLSSLSPGLANRYPIARRRRAWIVWLATQADELAAVIGVLFGFLATVLIVASASQGDPWPFIGRFCAVTTAAFALLPVARWIRLRWADARCSSAPLDAEAQFQDPRWSVAFGVSMATLLFGVVGAFQLYQYASVWLETTLSAPLHGWLPLVALVPIVLLRWLWLVALRRYFTRSDLAA